MKILNLSWISFAEIRLREYRIIRKRCLRKRPFELIRVKLEQDLDERMSGADIRVENQGRGVISRGVAWRGVA